MMLRKIAIAALLITASLVAAVEPLDADYLKSFEKWKAELVDGRKQHWLPLAGLFWLKPGENNFGSAPDNGIVLPSGPAHAGVFERQDKAVTVKLRSGVEAKIGEKIATESKLDADVTNHPTIIELGALRMFVIERGDRVGIRVGNLCAFGWQKNGGRSQRARRRHVQSDCRRSSFQIERARLDAYIV